MCVCAPTRAVLRNAAVAAEVRVIAHHHVAGHRRVVRHDHVIADDAVVADVHVRHEAGCGRRSRCGPALAACRDESSRLRERRCRRRSRAVVGSPWYASAGVSSPIVANWKIRLRRPIRVGPLSMTCDAIRQPSPISTSAPIDGPRTDRDIRADHRARIDDGARIDHRRTVESMTLLERGTTLPFRRRSLPLRTRARRRRTRCSRTSSRRA